MDFAAPHVGFVIAAFAISGVVLVLLAASIILRDRKRRAELKALENI